MFCHKCCPFSQLFPPLTTNTPSRAQIHPTHNGHNVDESSSPHCSSIVGQMWAWGLVLAGDWSIFATNDRPYNHHSITTQIPPRGPLAPSKQRPWYCSCHVMYRYGQEREQFVPKVQHQQQNAATSLPNKPPHPVLFALCDFTANAHMVMCMDSIYWYFCETPYLMQLQSVWTHKTIHLVHSMTPTTITTPLKRLIAIIQPSQSPHIAYNTFYVWVIRVQVYFLPSQHHNLWPLHHNADL